MNQKNNTLQSFNPATGDIIWQGHCASAKEINLACEKAKKAYPQWSALRVEERIDYLQLFNEKLEQNKTKLATIISQETGKPLWESTTEVAAMIGKCNISIKAQEKRAGTYGHAPSFVRHRSHGVIAILGPYNFPAHLPHGHMIPALLAGNCIIFKPSELTPKVAEFVFTLWKQCNLPEGVINLIQGDGKTGQTLLNHPVIQGVFFTGSYQTGANIHRLFAGRPEIILALEMGGNNPLIITQVSDLQAAAYCTIQSAYITAGQRCTCARRLIVMDDSEGKQFIECLLSMIENIKIGSFTDSPEPFMGPVISPMAAKQLTKHQLNLKNQGAKVLAPLTWTDTNTGFVTPGLIDVTDIAERQDSEYFGPLLQLIRCQSFEEAIIEANNTRYGLAAGILTENKALYETSYQQAHAGIINWNRQLTGASSAAPFGGIGRSGNHRPSAFYAADYCAYPVASIEEEKLVMPDKLTPGIDLTH